MKDDTQVSKITFSERPTGEGVRSGGGHGAKRDGWARVLPWMVGILPW